jgi:hypothetical protein
VAVLEGQIAEWNRPTRPTKRSDNRSKTFVGDSVEVDAIPPDQLRELVEDCITRHIDADRLERLQEVELAERNMLQSYAEKLYGNGGDGADE